MNASNSATLPGGLVAAVRPLDGALAGPWSALARDSFLPNPFYEPAFALPAAEAFGTGIQLLLVGDRPPEAPGLRLHAVWPFRRLRTRWGLPLPVLMGWVHGFCVYGVPLLDRADPQRALDGLLAAPRALGLSRRLMLPYLPTQGPFADLVTEAQRRAGTRAAAFWPHARACLDLGGLDAAARGDLPATLAGTRRRKLRQALARLEQAGPVTFETIEDPVALPAALDDYIALEAAGWKGAADTAIAGRPAEAAFMHGMAAALAAEGRVRIDRLRRAGHTLAASVLLRTGDRMWCLKISFDEAEARNSPGVQLVHHLTAVLPRDPGIRLVDSCAGEGYRLGEMFWDGREHLAHALVEAAGGDRAFPLALALERTREAAARWRQGRRGR